jgi:uncharacterized protein YndB with AHSA1/START domain
MTVGDLRDFQTWRRVPDEAVWDAIVDADQRAIWTPGISFEADLGGEFNIWFGGECEGPAHVTGSVSAFDPPARARAGHDSI